MVESELQQDERHYVWKWWVCALLLLATMINYMDRLTINSTAKRIKDELTLNDQKYGWLEFGFGMAFAVGSLMAGWSADRWNVRWLYPIAVIGWSLAGIATGLAQDFWGLLGCRIILGVFEGGNWACALRTTQRILKPSQRTLGNSVLQSGAAMGAIVTPLIVKTLVDGPGTWRYPFFVIGAIGAVWPLFWLISIRKRDLALQHQNPYAKESAPQSIADVYLQPRFLVLVVLVITINLTWHFFRVWLPLYLQENRDYTEADTLNFTAVYYVSADIGSICSGFVTLLLFQFGVSVHWSRLLVFISCACLTTLSVVVAFIDRGPLMLVLLVLLAFGALGLYPPYYSFSQDLTARHQGKVTGTLGFTTWIFTAIMHPIVGRWLDSTKGEDGKANYVPAVAVAGLFPLLGLAAMLLLWNLGQKRREDQEQNVVPEPEAKMPTGPIAGKSEETGIREGRDASGSGQVVRGEE